MKKNNKRVVNLSLEDNSDYFYRDQEMFRPQVDNASDDDTKNAYTNE